MTEKPQTPAVLPSTTQLTGQTRSLAPGDATRATRRAHGRHTVAEDTGANIARAPAETAKFANGRVTPQQLAGAARVREHAQRKTVAVCRVDVPTEERQARFEVPSPPLG